MAKDGLQAYLPEVHDKSLFTILADEAPNAIAERIATDPSLIGKTIQVVLPVSAPFQQLAKGETPKVLNPCFSRRSLQPSTP